MALSFTPPPDWLIQDYLTRKAPAQQASDTINQALQGYAAAKTAEHKQKNESLQTLLKASESVDLSDPNTAKAFAPLYKDAGVDPSIFNPAPVSTATTPSPDATPVAPATAGMPNAQGTTAMQAASPSPIVQASLAHPDHQTLNFTPEQIAKMSKTGYGRNVIASQEKGQGLIDKQTLQAEKDAENAPVSFDYARAKGEAAGFKDVAEPFIKIAKAEGRDKLSRKEMTDLKDAIAARTSGLRGNAMDSMASTREMLARDSLVKEARNTLDPYFQTGAGKQLAVKFNRINSTEPLVSQMMAQEGGGDTRQMRELGTSVANLITNGNVAAQEQINGMIPKTYKGDMNAFLEKLKNNPTGTDQIAFIHRLAETVAREKAATQSLTRTNAERTAPTLRVLKEHYPDDYNAVLKQYLEHSPEIMGPDAGGNTGAPVLSPAAQAVLSRHRG